MIAAFQKNNEICANLVALLFIGKLTVYENSLMAVCQVCSGGVKGAKLKSNDAGWMCVVGQEKASKHMWCSSKSRMLPW